MIAVPDHARPARCSCSAAWSRRRCRWPSASLAVVGTFLSLCVIGSLTDVSVFALNLTTALGLGLAIDYSLFIVSRYREELRARRHASSDAVVRTVRDGRAHGRVQRAHRRRLAGGPARVPARTSCARSPTPASPSCCWRWSASSWSCRRCWPSLGHRVDALRVCCRRRGRADRARTGSGTGSPTRVMRRPVAVADRRRRRPAAARRAVPARQLRRCPTTGCCRRRRPPPGRQRQIRAPTSTATRPARSRSWSPASPTPTPAPTIDAYAAPLSALAGVARVDAADRHLRRRRAGRSRPTPIAARFAPRRPARGSRSCPTVEPMLGRRASTLVHDVRGVDARADVALVGGPVGRSSSTPRRRSSARLPLAARRSSPSPRSCCCS